MSALEKFSIEPLPARHLLRAVSSAAALRGAEAPVAPAPLDALLRLAGQLLPSVLVVLDRGADSDPITWPPGVMGRRVALEPVARLLLASYPADQEHWVAEVAGGGRGQASLEVALAGPLAFARLPLGGGGSLGAIRDRGEWTAEERATLRDLAAAFSGALVGLGVGDDDTAAVAADPARSAAEERAREGLARLAGPMDLVGPLLSGVCHELNNPLTAIRSFAELLLLDARAEEDREALQIVQREAQRASRIVSDLRLIAGRAADGIAARDLIDLNEVVRTVLRRRLGELEQEGVVCLQDLAGELPAVRGVRHQLEQVVAHLLANAEDALQGREGTRCITVTTRSRGTRATLAVGDSGAGVAPEHLDRLFDPFWKGRPGGTGAGIGLTVVQRVVTDHGGLVMVESRPGGGALFTVELPGADELPTEVNAGAVAAGQGLRILVVDDEAPIRFSLVRYMERRGHKVDQAEDGPAALRSVDAAARGEGYDVVVADLRMPGIDGDQLLECLRERPDMENRIVLMTGEPQPCAAVLALQEGGVPVIAKPFELAEVAQVIESHARLHLASPEVPAGA